MYRLPSKTDLNNPNDDSTESDRSSPPTKRRCPLSNSNLCLSNQSSCNLVDLTPDDLHENKEECKSCGKQETLLRTLNCPSSHYFCLNCIFIWTRKHIQTKTPPACLVTNCGYLLKNEDLDDLPIAIKDHQILLQLMEMKINNNSNTTNLRIKCDKCYLYIDQHNFFIHQNECLGRSLTIPCEVCYCPVLIHDYEQHMLICNNDDHSALSQFLLKHLQNPNIDEKSIKLFISSWQRKQRRTIDVYEMIEEFNQTNLFSNEICDICKNTVRSDEFYSINCDHNHSSCLYCYRLHVQNQMYKNQILTCHQCTYHLQDKDLSDIRLFPNEQILVYQNYQNKKVIESYNDLYGAEDTFDINATIPPQNGTTINNDDTSRCKCMLCSKQHSYGNIFVLNCDCKICYDCFANEVNRQRTTTNEILICSLCRSPIKQYDLSNLRLTPADIQAIQLYQQGKLFEFEHAVHFKKQESNQVMNNNNNNNNNNDDDDDFDMLILNQQQCLPKYWKLPMLANFLRDTLDPQSTEFKFVVDKFYRSWGNIRHQFPGPVPTLPPIPVRPPPSFVAHPNANHPPPPFQPGLLQQGGPMKGPMSNLPLINPPPYLPPNHSFGNGPIPLPPGTNTIGPSRTLPPHPPFPPQQQLYRPMMGFAPPRAPMPLPTNNTAVPMRRSKSVNHGNGPPKIILIERIQNQRWYKQYSAHECEFRQKLAKQTEQWLFHGCDERSSRNIEVECFNRSYSGQHAVAFGQGCYFARDSLYSHSYALPDRNGIRRMFLARVLVGNTTQGNSTMRVAPSGFDTTGDGQSIFVTYHDSQAYAEYLISYR